MNDFQKEIYENAMKELSNIKCDKQRVFVTPSGKHMKIDFNYDPAKVYNIIDKMKFGESLIKDKEIKMNKDLEALNQLINDAVEEEKALTIKADELALQSKQFADYLAQKKHNDEKLEMLWLIVKEHMIENNIMEHETDFIKLKLSSSGRFRTKEDVDIDSVDDDLCDIKKTLSNKKVKAYMELNGSLPEGIESTGFVLRKTIKN